MGYNHIEGSLMQKSHLFRIFQSFPRHYSSDCHIRAGNTTLHAWKNIFKSYCVFLMSWKETYSVGVAITHPGNIGPAWPVWITLVVNWTGLHVAPFCVDLSISKSCFIRAFTYMILEIIDFSLNVPIMDSSPQRVTSSARFVAWRPFAPFRRAFFLENYVRIYFEQNN